MRTILLNPGPVNVSERVRAALMRGDLCHREPEFSQLLAGVRAKLLEAFAPRGFAAVLLTGSGTAAVEAMVASAVEPGRALAVVVNGIYGERIARMGRAHGIRVVEVAGAWTARPDLGAVEAALREEPAIQAVALVHHETTTGLLNPVAAVGALARRYDRLFLLDSVSGLGGEPLDLDAAGVDAVAGTANKCLEGLPGISFVLLRQEALARLQGFPGRSVYLDLAANWAAQEKGEPLFTPSIPILYALDEALAELGEETVAGRIARYREAAAMLRAGFQRLGLAFLLPPELRSNTLTALRLPPGLGYTELHDRLKAHGFVIYAGQGPLAPQIFRVATMGQVTREEYAAFLDALGSVLAGR